MDLSNKSDRQLLEEIWSATAGRALKPNDGVGVDDLMGDRTGSLPFVPVAGIERILGPKPEPQDSSKGTEWRTEAKKITSVLASVPQEYTTGVSVFFAVTDIVPVFFEYLGEKKVTVAPGLPLKMHDADRFLPGNVAGIIRSVLDSRK